MKFELLKMNIKGIRDFSKIILDDKNIIVEKDKFERFISYSFNALKSKIINDEYLILTFDNFIDDYIEFKKIFSSEGKINLLLSLDYAINYIIGCEYNFKIEYIGESKNIKISINDSTNNNIDINENYINTKVENNEYNGDDIEKEIIFIKPHKRTVWYGARGSENRHKVTITVNGFHRKGGVIKK